MNKALLDTDILSEVSKGIDPNVIRNATAYRNAIGHYTLSTVTVMEIVRGFLRWTPLSRPKNGDPSLLSHQ